MDTQHENRTEDTQELLPCELTPQEREGISDKVFLLLERIAKLEESKSSQAKDFNTRIKDLKAEVESLREERKSNSTTRAVAVRTEYDFVHGVIRTTRLDTGELVRDRIMTVEDRQEELDLDEPDDEPASDSEDLTALSDADLEARLKTTRDLEFETDDAEESKRLGMQADALAAEIERRSEANADADAEAEAG